MATRSAETIRFGPQTALRLPEVELHDEVMVPMVEQELRHIR